MSITQCISLVLIEVNLEGLLLDASYSPTTDPKTLPHIMKQTTKQTNHHIPLKKNWKAGIGGGGWNSGPDQHRVSIS